MAKKNFSAGSTKSGVLNNDGGEKLREIQAKTQYNFKYIPKDKINEACNKIKNGDIILITTHKIRSVRILNQ